MKHLLRLLLFAALALCVSSAMAQIQITPLADQKPAKSTPLNGHEFAAADAETWLDGMVSPAMQRDGIASAVVVVVKDGKVLLAKGYGYADPAMQKPVDPATTLFHVGSLSKLFTWTAVMQLVEQGKLDLDADVNGYLDFAIPPREGKPVTLRELMTHTAGFDAVTKHLSISEPEAASNEAWFETWVKQSLPPRVYAPGDVAAYSDYGAALAGYIVQRVSGQPFDDYIEQHILQPLGMRHASFRQPLPEPLAADLVRGDDGEPLPFDIRAAAPADGLTISGQDMARFMIAHLQNGRYGDAQLLRADTTQQMHDLRYYSVRSLMPIALGFYHMDRNGQDIIGQAGDQPLFYSELVLLPQAGAGLFVVIHGTDDGGLRRQLLDGFVDRYFPALPHVAEPTLASAREHGALLVGRYLSSRNSRSNFLSALNLFQQPKIDMLADGTLVTPGFRDPAGQPRHWREVKPFVWLDDASGEHLGVLFEQGVLRWVSIDELAPITVFMPVTFWQSAAWNLSLQSAALLVFLFTVIAWPVVALMQRIGDKPATLSSSAKRWYYCSRIVAILYLLFALGWWQALNHVPGPPSDGILRLIQGIGVLATIGIVAVIVNVLYAWREPAGWWRKAGSALLLLACLVWVWVTFSLHLLSVHLNY